MIRVVILTILGIITFIKSINFVNVIEKDSIIEIKKKGLISLLIALSTTLLYFKYNNSVEFYMYYYISIYLLISGYIDYKTKNVYPIFNWVTIIIGVIYLIYIKNMGIDIRYTITCVIIYIVLVKIMGYLNYFGEGDVDIYIALSIFIGCLKINSSLVLAILLLNMILSEVVLIITNIKLLDIKKMRFKKEIAFAPSIAISTMLFILLL